MTETPQKIFATAATCDRVDAGIGIIWWSLTPRGPFLLRVLDYDLAPMHTVNDKFLEALFQRGAELVATHRPVEKKCMIWAESGGLLDALRLAARAWFGSHPGLSLDPNVADVGPPPATKAAKWPPTLDERAAAIRPLVNSGTTIRLETGLRQFTFRAIKTNHLLAAIKNHRPGEPATVTELLNAFVLGILIERDSDKRMQLPEFTPIAPEGEGLLARMAGAIRRAISSPEAPAAPPRVPVPSIVLPLGEHEIDGKRVLVEQDPANPTRPDREVPLSPGGHVINGKIVIVPNPAANISVPLGRSR